MELSRKISAVEDREIMKAANRAAARVSQELKMHMKPRSFHQKLGEKTSREKRALTVKELRQKEMLKDTGKTSPGVVTLGETVVDEGNNNPSMYEIIREWNETPEDEVLSLSESHSLSIDPTCKPDLFPIQIWKYVRDDDRSNVANRCGINSLNSVFMKSYFHYPCI